MIFNHLTRVVVLVALALIVRNRLYRRCWSFVAYLLAILVCGSLMALWPGRFYHWWFWQGAHDLYAFLKVLVAVELGYYTFEAFPRASRIARGVTFSMLAALALVLYFPAPTFLPPSIHWFGFQAWRLRVNAGTIWLFAGLALLAAWYNLPLERWHRMLLAGFTVQLVVASLVLARQETYALSVAFDPLVAGWWVYSAWSVARVPAATRDAVSIYVAT